jgi:hypothetical protein
MKAAVTPPFVSLWLVFGVSDIPVFFWSFFLIQETSLEKSGDPFLFLRRQSKQK